MSSVFPDPSFTWHSRRRERCTWRSIGPLLAIAAVGGFFVGRLSSAEPAPTQQLIPEQQAASAGSVTQRHTAVQSGASLASIHSTANKATKPEAKDGPRDVSSVEPLEPRTIASTEEGASSPPVALINPSRADKAADGEASKQHSSKAGPEAAANAKRIQAQKAVQDGRPAATASKRRAESRSPARSSAGAPTRRDAAVVRRDDAYVPTRLPQASYADQRGRYDNAAGDDDRPRFGQVYPDRRYAEDGPPPRTYYEYRREYLRPFQDSGDLREYRRFGGYDDDPYTDRRPLLRQMYGGPDY